MRSVILQILLLFFASGELAKRSPLELGLVSFAEKPHLSHNGTHKETSIVGAHTHKWIPGHVHHHSYIPAHLHHFYVPAHTVLVARTLFVQPGVYSPYREHIGGFGIGLDVGGHGAGHGYHVVVNL